MDIKRTFNLPFDYCALCTAFSPVVLRDEKWNGSIDYVCEHFSICMQAKRAENKKFNAYDTLMKKEEQQ